MNLLPRRLAWTMRRLSPLLAYLVPVAADAAELKIATWNLDWLTTRQSGDPYLPSDVIPRAADDFARLAQYARELNADVVALQEVDGFAAASKLFPREQYSIHLTHDHVTQRVGIAVRRGLRYEVNPDLSALAENHLRSGADITLHWNGSDLRILAVHLKKGCRDTPMPRARGTACEELKAQIAPIAEWIAARRQDNIPFIILGDFNRWMDGNDSFLAGLKQSGPLLRTTEGRSSPCWGGENFIDHILLGGPAINWLRPDSLRVLAYRETDRSWQDRLSDHCPVSIRLDLPD